MKKLEEFLKRIKVRKEDELHENISEPEKQENEPNRIEIDIEGDIKLFNGEEETIMEGAKQLLALGKAENIEEAIITFAVMMRGLKFKEIKKTEDGRIIVVFCETVQEEAEIINRCDEDSR